jgi:protein-ribulosamine 3-kinase
VDPLVDQIFPIKLTDGPLRLPLEQFVSETIGRQWTVKASRDMADFACHPAAILSDGSYPVFAKFSEAANGREQFEIELAGLRLLSDRSGVLIPTPIGILPAAGGCFLVLEAVQAVERAPRQWREIGQALARIHKIKGDRFGLASNCYFGPLHQDNTPMDDWPTFYAERRLQPGLRLAVDSGNLPAAFIPRIERIIARLPELCGPNVSPALLHGDAQQNNFVSTAMGAVVIDPAVYFGHPEMDLAFVDYFQPVPQDVFDGYQQELPIDPGFWERRGLWRIWGWLACITIEGPVYGDRLTEAVLRYA